MFERTLLSIRKAIRRLNMFVFEPPTIYILSRWKRQRKDRSTNAPVNTFCSPFNVNIERDAPCGVDENLFLRTD